MNIFEYASKHQLRFSSSVGMLTTEDLWTVPLTASNGFSLDAMAQWVDTELSKTATKSFVTTKVKGNKQLEVKLEILKRIIEVKLAAIETAEKASATKAKKTRILELIMAKRDDSMKEMTEEELQAELDAL